MTGKHPDGTTRRSRHLGFPEFGGQMLDEKNRYPIIGLPRVKDRISQVEWGRHASSYRALNRLGQRRMNVYRVANDAGRGTRIHHINVEMYNLGAVRRQDRRAEN